MRRTLYILGAIALLLVAAVATSFAVLQTQAGQTWLAATLSRALSSGESQVTISGLSGTVPTVMRIDRIEVADRSGAWLQVDDAALQLRLRDLLRGQLTVRRLAADSISVQRAPAAGGPSQKPSQPFSLPRLPVDLALQSLAIGRLQLGEALLGQEATVRIVGQGALASDGATAQLAVDRVDDMAGNLSLDFRLGRDRVLAVHLDAAEPSGMLLQHALDQPQPLPVKISVHGEGPLDAWQGRIEAMAGTQERLEATVKLERKAALQITSEGSVSMQQLLPQEFRSALTGPIGFAARAQLDDARIVLERLSIDSNLATIAAQGALEQKSERFSGTADLNAPDLQPIGAMLNVPLGGSVTAHVKAEGTADAPRIDLALQATQFASNVRAGRIALNLQGTKQGERWTIQGNGDASELVWPNDRAGVPDALTLALSGQIDQGANRLTIDDLTLRGGEAQIAASGTVEDIDTTPRGRGKISLTADNLARWQDVVGLPAAGRLAITSDLTLEAGAVNAKIAASSDDLVTGEQHLDALLAKRLDLHARVARGADGALALEGLELAGANIAAKGNAASNADFSSLDARLDVDLPRRAVLAAALGTPTQGAASVQAHLAGSLAAPQAQIDVRASDLRYGDQRLDRLTAKVALDDAIAPRGTLTAALKAGALDATADAAFARTRADTIEVSRLAVRAPGSALNGNVRIDTARPGAAGLLTVRISDLSPWSSLAGMALAGAADARIDLADKDGQRANIDATVSKLRLASQQAAAERIKIEARLSDLLGKPAGRANVEAAGVALPDLRLDSVRASAQSSRPEQFAISLDTQGVVRPAADAQALRLSTAGEVALGARERRIRVTRLSGRLGTHDIVSRAPLTVALAGTGFKVEGLDLGIDSGRVTGSASREATRFAVQAQVHNLPLALIQLAMPGQQIAGTADATIRMAGTATQPDGQMEVNLRGVRLAAAADLPPLSATARGAWKDEVFDITGQVAAAGGTKVDLRGSVPVKLDAATMTPVLIQDGSLRATLKGDGRLEQLVALLPLGEDRISGRYSIDVAVAGTPARPEPHGSLTIGDGRYVNFAAGTEVSNLAAEISGDGSHFVLNRLTGNDGARGTLEGKGTLDLGASGPVFDIAARFTNFGFTRRDDVTASGDGELNFTGAIDSAKLSGQLRVARAEIRIPDRLPPSIPDLPVIRIDSRSGEVLSKPEQTTGSAPAAIALAVDVTIPGRTFVRGQGLDSEWRGALKVGGTTKAPQLTGQLEIVRGDFSLLGKRFSLTDSAINFVGGEKIDPQLAITAEYQATTILAQVVVSGTASAPSIRLTSQPEVPQDEVLARVLFGRSASDITPAQGLELAQAAASLAGGGPGIIDRVRTATGLDRLDISSNGTAASSGEPAGTTITAGKYVSDRVFVGVEQGMKGDTTRPKVEVEITPNVTVDSSVGASSAGVGVNWRWDY